MECTQVYKNYSYRKEMEERQSCCDNTYSRWLYQGGPGRHPRGCDNWDQSGGGGENISGCSRVEGCSGIDSTIEVGAKGTRYKICMGEKMSDLSGSYNPSESFGSSF